MITKQEAFAQKQSQTRQCDKKDTASGEDGQKQEGEGGVAACDHGRLQRRGRLAVGNGWLKTQLAGRRRAYRLRT